MKIEFINEVQHVIDIAKFNLEEFNGIKLKELSTQDQALFYRSIKVQQKMHYTKEWYTVHTTLYVTLLAKDCIIANVGVTSRSQTKYNEFIKKEGFNTLDVFNEVQRVLQDEIISLVQQKDMSSQFEFQILAGVQL